MLEPGKANVKTDIASLAKRFRYCLRLARRFGWLGQMVKQLRRVITRIIISNYNRNSSITNYSDELSDQCASTHFIM